MAKLVLSTGGSIVQQCFLDRERVSVGRDPRSQIVIDDPAVAPEHAAITPVGNDHILEDLRSGAGTRVNGERVSRYILQHGDVIELGAFYLRYLNPRASAEIDLERTMLITGLRGRNNAGEEPGALLGETRVPTARTGKIRFPKASVSVRAGDRTGSTIELDRVVATFGREDGDLAVIARRPQGYFLSQVHGRHHARVNGRSIDDGPRLLADGDVIEVANQRLEFRLG